MILDELKNLEGTKADRRKLTSAVEAGQLTWPQAFEVTRHWSKAKVTTLSKKEEFIKMFGETPEVIRQADELFD